MYGGGQFELGAGRRQIQKIASVFYRRRAERRRAVRVQRGRRARRACRRARCPLRTGSASDVNLFDAELAPAASARATRRASSSSARARRRRLGRDDLRARARASGSARITGTSREEEWLLVLAGTPTLRDARRRAGAAAVGRRRVPRAAPAGAHEVRNDTDELATRADALDDRRDPRSCVYPDSGKIGVWWPAGTAR